MASLPNKPQTKLQRAKECCQGTACLPTKEQLLGDTAKQVPPPDGLCSVPCRKTQLKRPLLDVETCCGVFESCGEKSTHDKLFKCCGSHCTVHSKLSCKQQWCTLCMIMCGCYLIFGGIVQFICFHFATLKCGNGHPADDYSFPSGGHGVLGGPEVQLVPRHSILTENEPEMFYSSLGVWNATDSNSKDDYVGRWFRTPGPFFATYTFQDKDGSQPLIYMRASLMSMIFQYYDDWIMRCDGKGDPIRLSEGHNFMINRIRQAFGMTQGYTLRISEGGVMIASALESFHSEKSIDFINLTSTPVNQKFASSTLFQKNRDGMDEWNVKDHTSVFSSMPYWQINGMSALYAFRIHHINNIRRARTSDGRQPAFGRQPSFGNHPVLLPSVAEVANPVPRPVDEAPMSEGQKAEVDPEVRA